VKCLVIADHRVFYGIFARSVRSLVEASFWLDKGERTPYPELVDVFRGDPDDPLTYASFDPTQDHVAVIYLQKRSEAERVAATIQGVLPRSSFLFLGLDEELPSPEILPRARVRPWEHVISGRIADEVRALLTSWRVERIREIFAGASKIAVLLQDDPDPDAIASGLCFRNLIGRNRVTAPLVTFGGIARPENREMVRLLDIPVETIRPADLELFDRIACLDVQPNVFGERLALATRTEVDAVIDHHPEQTGYRARYRDIRASYGATSTILTEYLRAADMEVNQKQATALLYGIKSDTLGLDREVSSADVESFMYLYGKANVCLLRRIEKPHIPLEVLKTFGTALRKPVVENGLSFAFLGEVEREDVIPQLADLLLQIEGAEWSVASGVHEGRLVASIRNAGYQKAAGEVAKRIFGEVGSAGGHRMMAKAVVPVARFAEAFGGVDEKSVREVFYGRFLEEASGAASC
jgi:nanoRNase/pAp phosphatase (c-di-AMP/oligoRNAs hydrolase)